MLGRLGYQVVACDSAIRALEELQHSPNVFDLALIDIAMADMNGIDLAKKILARQPDMKIIFNTGFLGRITLGEAHEMGVKAIVKKPWTMEELSQVVEQVLHGNGQG